MRDNFLQSEANADMNGDNAVDFLDVARLTQMFFANYSLNNPSTVPNVCDQNIKSGQ